MQSFQVKTDRKGSPRIVSTGGVEIVASASDPDECSVLTKRVASMLNHYERRIAYELGEVNSYSGGWDTESVIGSNHVTSRQKLLKLAREAEREAERWADYGKQLLAVATPPELVPIPEISEVGVGDDWALNLPVGSMPMPNSPYEGMRLAIGYAAANGEAYLAIANQAREQLRERYAEEDAALEVQAARMMDDELGEA